ncbi:MAG: hypothetical protein GuTV1_gp3 [Guiyang tombus-like virus 1]|nr:MAG: hypothetical protein GuTV1_gp3 [Guiyang tombus-like virus 1]
MTANMQVAQRSTGRRLAQGILPYVPALLNVGTRMARQYWDMNRMRDALPAAPPQSSNPPKRRRNRRRGRQAKPSSMNGAVRVVDTEKWIVSTDKFDYKEFPFSSASRLAQYAKMYGKYNIKRVNIKTCGLIGSAVTGTFHYGIAVDSKLSTVIDADTIMKLAPSRSQHASATSSITVTHDMQLSKWMDSDTHAFTLYWKSSVANTVVVEVSYDITFASPRPF